MINFPKLINMMQDEFRTCFGVGINENIMNFFKRCMIETSMKCLNKR